MPFFSMVPNQSDRHGMVIRPTSATGGDCFCPPPGASVNSSLDRYRVDPGREDVDRHAGDDVVDPDGHRHQGVQQPAEQPADRAEEHPGPWTPLVARVAGAEGAEDHHALDADVHHTGPLRPQAGQAGQRDRRRGDDRGLDGAGRGQVVAPVSSRTAETTRRSPTAARSAPTPTAAGARAGGRRRRRAGRRLRESASSSRRSCRHRPTSRCVASALATSFCSSTNRYRRTNS